MRKLTALFLVVALLALSAPQPVHAAAPTDYVSCWDLNETSGTRIDSNTTNSNDLTDNNTVLSGTGKVGNAADFELATAEYLSITDANQANLDMTGDMSFALWVNYESLPTAGNDRGLISKWNGGGWMFYSRIASSIQRLSVGVNSAVNVTVNWTPSTATWYHLVATYKQSTGAVVIYKDGASLGTGTGATTNPNNANRFELGSYEAGLANMDGLFDIVEVYNRVLTADEVTALYNGGSGVGCTARSGGSAATPQSILFE